MLSGYTFHLRTVNHSLSGLQRKSYRVQDSAQLLVHDSLRVRSFLSSNLGKQSFNLKLAQLRADVHEQEHSKIGIKQTPVCLEHSVYYQMSREPVLLFKQVDHRVKSARTAYHLRKAFLESHNELVAGILFHEVPQSWREDESNELTADLVLNQIREVLNNDLKKELVELLYLFCLLEENILVSLSANSRVGQDRPDQLRGGGACD